MNYTAPNIPEQFELALVAGLVAVLRTELLSGEPDTAGDIATEHYHAALALLDQARTQLNLALLHSTRERAALRGYR